MPNFTAFRTGSVVLFAAVGLDTAAQTCECAKAFDWMVATFEQNDAGFRYVVDKKGDPDYAKYTTMMREKAVASRTVEACTPVLAEWLSYFRKGHIGVGPKEQPAAPGASSGVEPTAVKGASIDLDEGQLIARLSAKGALPHPVEGVWSNGSYRVGIVRDAKNPQQFAAFIIQASNASWSPRQVKAEFTLGTDGRTFSGTYFMGDHSPKPVEATLIGQRGSILSMSGYWVRAYPEQQLDDADARFMRFATSEGPYIEKLSDRTVYLRIPSFLAEAKQAIDSVLTANDALITRSPNLIIDIRSGTGGSDESYRNIMPYLYTNPIRSVGVRLLATELNAQGFERYATLLAGDTASANYCQSVARKMRANMGTFITMTENTYDVQRMDKVLPMPQHVGIICNEGNGSTDEQFLLDAKPSRKVKVFGHSTQGVLDISNMNFTDSPDGLFTLAYSMSKSYRIPHYCIDGVGIQPDYFLDDAIPEEEWVDHVRRVLEE